MLINYNLKYIINVKYQFYLLIFCINLSFSQKKDNFENIDTLQINFYNKALEAINNKNYKKSILQLNKSLSINNNNEIATKVYYKLGYIHYLINDYESSLKYLFTSKQILEKNNILNELLIKTLSSITFIELRIGTKTSFKYGIKYGLIADSLSNFIPVNWNRRFLTKLNIGSLYNQHEFLDTLNSNKFYQDALKIALKNKDSFKITQTYIALGSLYNTTNIKKSLNYYDKALVSCLNNDTINLRQIQYSYGLTYAYDGDYKKSINIIHTSFKTLFKNDLRNLKKFNKNLILNSIDKNILVRMLQNLAKIYLKYYEKTQNKSYLKKSINYFKLSDYTLDLILNNNQSFKSKIFWKKMSTETYGKAIKACYLKKDLDQAFYFMEKNKALLLMEDIATQTYRQTLDVPMASLEEENNLKHKLLLTKNFLETAKNQTKKDSLNKVLLDTNRELFTLQDSIYKDEKITKKAPKIRTVKEVQENLKENEVFVEYHVSIDDGYGIYTNRENGYVVVLTKNKKYFFEINELSKLKEEVSTLINALKSPFKTNESFSNYNSLANTVYKKLFPTPEIRDLLKNKKVKIAPDSYLSLLPFETLITKITKDTNKPNYLIKDCNISYLYSYSFLKHHKIEENDNKNFLGFAPVSFKYDNLSDINNSKTEIENLKNYYNGDSFLDSLANKQTFLEKLENYNIIHLATHANAQDSISPWIAFNDKKLSLDELYLAKNKASLVVLSGCNTTLGKQEIGEGIMSLARGFFYGGSQSVVSSLWNVDDTATPYIMNEFYKNLSQGKTKSEALHLAKLNYLDNHSLSEASPHFWASFILLGQDNLVETNANYYLFWWIGLLVIVLGLFYWMYRNWKSRMERG